MIGSDRLNKKQRKKFPSNILEKKKTVLGGNKTCFVEIVSFATGQSLFHYCSKERKV